MLDELGVAPEDALFVGDTWTLRRRRATRRGYARRLPAARALRRRLDRARATTTRSDDVHRADGPRACSLSLVDADVS